MGERGISCEARDVSTPSSWEVLGFILEEASSDMTTGKTVRRYITELRNGQRVDNKRNNGLRRRRIDMWLAFEICGT